MAVSKIEQKGGSFFGWQYFFHEKKRKPANSSCFAVNAGMLPAAIVRMCPCGRDATILRCIEQILIRMVKG